VKSLFLISIFFILSCGSQVPQRERPKPGGFDPELCNEQAGYEIGMQDGRKNENMNSSFASRCREDLRILAEKGYKSGYSEGQNKYREDEKARREEMKIWEERKRSAGTTPPQNQPINSNQKTINISIGGKQILGGSANQTQNEQNPKAYYCNVSAFGKSYESFGPTKIEAEIATKSACTKENHEMHCREIDCMQNK
jgi:hypothetical protein